MIRIRRIGRRKIDRSMDPCEACFYRVLRFEPKGGIEIKAFLENVRKPRKGISIKRKIAETVGIILFGLALGVLQKWLDAASTLPEVIQQLDIANYFGRLAIWILLATVISVYAESPLRAAVNTFLFFLSMLAGYYSYCYYILGFLPKTYMMIWIVISFLSFFMAYLCWYAKGEGIAAISISSLILGSLFAQAFDLTHGFYIYRPLEVFTWMIGVILLRRKPKEYAVEIGLSVIAAFVYELILPHWG